MGKIVIASGNTGKIEEFGQLLASSGLEVVSQSELGISSPPETGTTFVENAIIKARWAAQHSGLPALADDSGLAVDYLDGAPGIYSARYSGDQASDYTNNQKLLSALAGVADQQRGAHYYCLIVYMRHAKDPVPLICEGSWEGQIVTDPRGTGGFGYDPLFYVPALGKTAAQLPPEEKNRLSHRGKAMDRLSRKLAAHGQ